MYTLYAGDADYDECHQWIRLTFRNARVHSPFLMELLMFMSSNYMSLRFFVPCCDVSYDCRLLSPFFGSSLTPFILQKVDILFMLFVFIYVYWCPTRFLYQMMFVSFNSNTTSVTCRAWLPFRITCVHYRFLVGFV